MVQEELLVVDGNLATDRVLQLGQDSLAPTVHWFTQHGQVCSIQDVLVDLLEVYSRFE